MKTITYLTVNLRRMSLAICGAIALAACASIIGGSGPQSVLINSNPNNVSFKITNARGHVIHQGRTPGTVSLSRSQGFFEGARYNVEFIGKKGKTIGTSQVSARITGWYVANILFGGLIGLLIIDPATGAMWTLDRERIDIELSSALSSDRGAGWGFATLDDIPESYLAHLKPVRR